MADQSRDPAAQANFAKLQEDLAALRAEQTQIRAAQDAELAEIRTVSADVRAGGGAARVSGGEAAALTPGVVGETTAEVGALQRAIDEVNAALRAGDDSLAAQLDAERSLTTAAKERLAIEDAQAAQMREQVALSAELRQARGAGLGQRTQISSALTESPAARAAAADEAQITEQAALIAQLRAQRATAAGESTLGQRAGISSLVAGAGVPASPAESATGTVSLSSVSEYTAAQQALIDKAKQIPLVEKNVSAAMEETSRTLSLSSLAYRQHGALTTEFIAAAAKGQVTIKELGDQMLLTIGKFAGWTAAAAATYGVIGALGGIAKGATDAASGVEQLNRFIDNVNTNKAQEQFRALSAANNVSIKDAADATASFAKIFQNQDEAVQAADVALKATQLDQISLADSTRFLTGAIVGFRLPASSLPLIFDQINNAQRRFGASVAQSLAAIGGSAAAVHNAGGDFNDYIALVTAAQRATAQTGSVIGTAFRRSATSFVTKASNQEILRSFGLDPTEAYTQLVLDAVQKAKTLTGQQINQLAQGLGGPQQGARVFAGLLQRPDLVNRALDVTAPATASGSAAQEMAHKLAQADQQIKAVAFSMERLGSALAQSGALAPLLLVLKGFTDVLDITTQLLDAVDKLPAGIGQILIPLAEVTVAFRLLRNLDFGSRLSPNNPLSGVLGSSQSGGAGLLRPSANRSAQKDFEKGLDEQTGFYENLRQGAAQSGARLEAQIASQRLYIATLATQGADDDVLLREQQTLEGLTERSRRALFEQGFYRDAIAELDEQNTARLALIQSGLSADAAAVQAGFRQRAGTLTRPSTEPAGPVILPPGVEAPIGATSATEAALAEQASAETEQIGLWGAVKARLAAQLALEDAALAEATAAGTAETAAMAANTVATEATAVETGLMAGAVNTWKAATQSLSLGMGGWLTLITGVVFGYELISNAIDSENTAVQQAATDVRNLQQHTKSLSDFRVAAEGLRSDLEKQVSAESDSYAAGANPLQNLDNLIAPLRTSLERQITGITKTALPTGGSVTGISTSLGKVTQGGVFSTLIKQAQDDAKTASATTQGRTQWLNEIDQLTFIGQDAANQAKSGLAPKAASIIDEAFKAFSNELNQIKASFQRNLSLLTVNAKTPFAQFESQPAANIVSEIQAQTDRAKIYGASSGTFRQIAFAYEYLAREFANSNNDKDLQLVSQAQSNFIDAVRTDAQRLADEAATASGAKRKDLLDQARAILISAREQLGQAADAVRAGVKADQTAYDAAVAEMKLIDAAVDNAGTAASSSILTFAAEQQAQAGHVAAARAKLENARKALTNTANANDEINSQLDSTLKSLNSQAKSSAGPASEDPFSLDKLRRELQAARDQGNDVAAARDSAAEAQDEIAAAKNTHDRLQGQIDLANADKQLATAMQNQAAAWSAYRAALTQDPVKSAEITLQGAEEAVAASIRNSGAGSAATAQALTSEVQARQALAKAIEDRAQATYTLRESQTQNPVTQALLALKAAEQQAANTNQTEGPNTADALKADAAVNDAKNKLVAARLQASEDTIQFDLDMGKITQQTAVQQYDALLKMKGITLAAKRQIQEAIHQLQTGSDLDSDLNLGSIKLPTAYEVRRAYLAAVQGGGQPGTGTNVTQNYSTTIQVTDTRSASKVGEVFDRYHRGTGKAVKRAIGISKS